MDTSTPRTMVSLHFWEPVACCLCTAAVHGHSPAPTSAAAGPRSQTSLTTAILKGTVNDATTFPPPSKAHGSYHWAFERLVAAAIIPLSVGAFAASPTAHPALDAILSATLVAHTHMGFVSCIDDYTHERKFGALGHAARWALRFGTAGALYGLYEFNTNDIGITELLTKLWTA